MMSYFIILLAIFSSFTACVSSSRTNGIPTNSQQSPDNTNHQLENSIRDSIDTQVLDRILRITKEPDLRNVKTESYRFFWDRAFHNEMIFRIDLTDTLPILIVKTYNIKSITGLGRDSLLTHTEKVITLSDLEKFKLHLVNADYWHLDSGENEGEGWLDGSYWTVEGYSPELGIHHSVTRFSPQNGEFRKACMELIKLYGQVKKNQIY